MLLLSKEDIKKVFTMKDAIKADKEAFRMVAENRVDMPLRTVIEEKKHDGAFLFMPSYTEEKDAAAVKVINTFPHNIDQGLNSCPAQVLLIDGQTGYINALLDGICVTQFRTGASSGAAFDVLGRKDAKIGGMIGTGGQAAAQLEAMLAVRDLKKVYVFDLNFERCKEFCEQMNKSLSSYETEIIPVKSSDDAVIDADLLVTVTPSPKPVFDGTKVKKGATISCVGTYVPDKHEMDSAVLKRASKIYCDSKEAVLEESGDILIPIHEGLITADDITGDIGNVINGTLRGRESDEEIIVYETVGVSAQDLVTAQMIYENAVKSGVGTTWE